ncbi:MAG: YSC84-related protein [Flavobacteriaceae bacterium]
MRNLLFLVLSLALVSVSYSQGWKPELEQDCKQTLATMITDAPKLQTYKDQAYGYAVYPIITKAGLVIGGAAGEGMVFQKGHAIARSKLTQGSFGLQAGGQQYSEVIFFQHEEAFNRFKSGNLKFNAQASAVAVVPGASFDVAYQDGVAVFTRVKGGVMAEASLGGQHFSYILPE